MHPYLQSIAVAATSSVAVPVRFRTRLLNGLGARFEDDAVIHAGARFGTLRIRAGRRLFINSGFSFDGVADLQIGDDVAFGPDVKVVTAGHTTDDAARRCSPTATSAPVSIGSAVWVGAGVIILPGVNIARGCVVGAGSVVTRDTAEHGVYVGVPARRLRDLPT